MSGFRVWASPMQCQRMHNSTPYLCCCPASHPPALAQESILSACLRRTECCRAHPAAWLRRRQVRTPARRARVAGQAGAHRLAALCPRPAPRFAPVSIARERCRGTHAKRECLRRADLASRAGGARALGAKASAPPQSPHVTTRIGFIAPIFNWSYRRHKKMIQGDFSSGGWVPDAHRLAVNPTMLRQTGSP